MTLLAESRPVAAEPMHQRRHLRLPVSWSAELRLGQSRAQAARVIDVSQGGVGIVADDMLPAASVLELHIRLRASAGGAPRTFAARAKVIHQVFAAGRTRAGLQFVDIGAADARWLVELASRGG